MVSNLINSKYLGSVLLCIKNHFTPTCLALYAVTPSALSQNMDRYATFFTVQFTCPLNPGHTCTGDTTAAAGIHRSLDTHAD